MNEREKIGCMISALRERRGYTMRQLAELSGVTHQNIWKIEHGKYNVSIDILGKLADALECSIVVVENDKAAD